MQGGRKFLWGKCQRVGAVLGRSTQLARGARGFDVGLSVHHEIFNSTPGHDPLDANSMPWPSRDNQKYLQTLPSIPWGPNCPQLRTTEVDG